MAKKQSIKVARDRIFMAVEELNGLVPAHNTHGEFLEAWRGLMRFHVAELQLAVEEYAAAAEEAREVVPL